MKSKIVISKGELIELYSKQELNIKKIAKKYKCSYTLIRNRLLKYNIPIRDSHYWLKNGMPQSTKNKIRAQIKKNISLGKYYHREKYIIDVPKSVIEDLYINKKLSIRNIASMLNHTQYQIRSGMLYYKIPRKNRMKGIHHTQETKEKLRKIFLNRTFPPETIEKMRKAKEGLYNGSNNPNWRGGRGDANKIRLSASSWRRIATKIRQRDNYKCQVCGKELSYDVHHIIPYAISSNFMNPNDDSNLITVCQSCHKKLESFFYNYLKILLFLIFKGITIKENNFI